MSSKNLSVCLLAASLALPAQQAPPAAAEKPAAGGSLEIVVIEGEGGKNNVRARTAAAPIVEVREDGKPVAGAEVVFSLPPVGPSGTFGGWLKNQTVRTDAQGRATVTGYVPNTETGRFNIRVLATHGAKSGSLVVAQSNVENGSAGEKKSNWWKWALAVGGAGAIAGIAASASGDDSPSAAKAPVTITSGPVTVAGPR